MSKELVRRDSDLAKDVKIKLAVIGGGAMGSAIVNGAASSGTVKPENIIVADIDTEKLRRVSEKAGVNTTGSNTEAVEDANVVLIALKPGFVRSVLDEIAESINPDALVISIAAGVPLEKLEAHLRDGQAVVRAMPNTPCQVGAGAVAFARGGSATDEHARVAKVLFDSLGVSFEVPERLLDAVTGLSGSGPAYVFIMIEALSDAGVRVGLPRAVSLKLAAQTVYGSAKMLLDTNGHPACLKDAVTSPGGTTIAGVDELEKGGFRSAVIEAVKAAAKRSEELS